MPRTRLLPLLACLGALSGVGLGGGCASSRRPADASPESGPTTTVRVDNRGFLDMTVYVLDGALRVRLGIAAGNRVTELTIPPYLVRGPTSLRFLCDPIGSDQAPVSDEIVVEPGNQVTLEIPAH